MSVDFKRLRKLENTEEGRKENRTTGRKEKRKKEWNRGQEGMIEELRKGGNKEERE